MFIMGIFFKRISGMAAFGGVVIGLIVLLYLQAYSSMSFLLYGAAGIVASVASGLLLSVVWPQRKSTEKLTYRSQLKN